MDNWDPEPAEFSALVDSSTDYSTSKSHRPPIVKLRAKAAATERFAAGVEAIMRTGVVTAGGSGHRAPIPSMNHESLSSIIARVPSTVGLLEDGLMQHLLGRELSYVQDEYFKAAARSCVEYDIRDPVEAMSLGVNVDDLIDESCYMMWTNKEYSFKEWRVVRATHVSSRKVLRSYKVIDRALRHNLQVRFYCTPVPV